MVTATVAEVGAGRVEADGLGVVERALELHGVVWLGELVLVAGLHAFWDVGRVNRVEDSGAEADPLLHDGAVAEFGDETLAALDGGVRDLAGLLGAVHAPWLADTLFDKADNVLRLGEVDKGIADVAVVGEVDTEVREVVQATTGHVQPALEVLGVKLVGNVADHDGGAAVLAGHDAAGTDMLGLSYDVLWTGTTNDLFVDEVVDAGRDGTDITRSRPAVAATVLRCDIYGDVAGVLDVKVVGLTRDDRATTWHSRHTHLLSDGCPGRNRPGRARAGVTLRQVRLDVEHEVVLRKHVSIRSRRMERGR